MNEEPVNFDGINLEWVCDQVGTFLQKEAWKQRDVDWAMTWMKVHQSHPRNSVNLTEAQAKVILTMCRVTYPPKGEP